MKKILTFLAIVSFLNSFADPYKLAMINDTDGFANVRSGPGKEFEVVTVIHNNEPFYCEYSDAEWIKIHSYKNGNVAGYMHKSRVHLVELLSLPKQKDFFTYVLREHKMLADDFQNKLTREAASVSENHSDSAYSPILGLLPGYVCATKDTELIQLLFATMWADSGSANELPAFAVGECFACQTDIMMTELKKLGTEQRVHIIEGIEWGLMNIYSADEEGNSDDPEYDRLMKRLDTAR